MDYIYDIVLNFKDKYYDFYEWNSTDKLINLKRIPIYKINSEDYLNIKNNDVTIDRNTISKQNKIFLITSGIEVMGIMIDDKGRVLKKSSLIFEESDDILEDIDEITKISIKYNINNINKVRYQSRIAEEKYNYIYEYLNKLDKKKDEYLLKYLHYDIYNNEENNIDIIYNDLLKIAKKDINKIYNSIKKINLEFKKTSK